MFPIMVSVFTGACSSNGMGSSCAPIIRISSQPGIGMAVAIAAEMLFPETAIS